MKNHGNWFMGGAGAGIIMLSPGFVQPLLAQEAMMLEEVVVTARKREESLQDTPIAVTAINSEGLRAAQIYSLGDLTREVPGLSRREGRKTSDLNIRGVGVRQSDNRTEPGVGVYVDSIFIPRNDSQLVDVLNMESVQVLRGPQGTLFGKNTIGGAMLLTTKKPGQEFGGFVQANVGDLNRRRLRAAVNGPLVRDRLYAGLTVDRGLEDGYREDPLTGYDFGDTNKSAVAAQFRYESEQIFTGDLLLFWSKQDEMASPINCRLTESGGGALQDFTAPGVATPYTQLCDQSLALEEDDKVLMDRVKQKWQMENRLAGMTLAWDLSGVTIKSITGYLDQDNILQSNDVDASNLFAINNQSEFRRHLEGSGIDADGQRRRFFSQELQFVGAAFDDFFEYTVGMFYSREKIEDETVGNVIGPGGFIGSDQGDGTVAVFPPAVAGFRGGQISNFENQSAALFSQFIFHFSDMWQLTLGGRYTWEERKADQVNYVTATTAPSDPITRDQFDALETFVQDVVVNPANPSAEGEQSWNEFTPAATLSMFTPEAWHSDGFNSGMLYLSASNGFKAGGFTPFGDEFLPFDPEKLWAYELGFKLDMWSNRIRFNGAVYHSRYEDMQIQVTRTLDDEGSTTLFGVTNAGESTINGAELEFSVLPVNGLYLGFTGSYIDPSYQEFNDEDPNTGEIIDRSGEDFAFVPTQTYSLTVQYDWQTDVGAFIPRLSGYYVDENFFGLDAASASEPSAYLDSYTTWNFRFAWQLAAAEGLELAAYVNNLTDEDYFGSGIITVTGVGAAALVPGKQRTFGMELYYSW